MKVNMSQSGALSCRARRVGYEVSELAAARWVARRRRREWYYKWYYKGRNKGFAAATIGTRDADVLGLMLGAPSLLDALCEA